MMRNVRTIRLRTLLWAAVSSVALMGAHEGAWAQSGPAIGAPGAQALSPKASAVVQILRSGNVDQAAAALASAILEDPQGAAVLSREVESAALAMGGPVSTRLVGATAARLSNTIPEERALNGVQSLAQGAVAAALSASAGRPGDDSQQVRGVIGAALSAAARDEASLGHYARAIAAGALAGFSQSGAPVGANAIDAVVAGISEGAVRVAGIDVTVNVITENSKAVEDVILTTRTGIVITSNSVVFPSEQMAERKGVDPVTVKTEDRRVSPD